MVKFKVRVRVRTRVKIRVRIRARVKVRVRVSVRVSVSYIMTIRRWEEFSRCDKFPTTPDLYERTYYDTCMTHVF